MAKGQEIKKEIIKKILDAFNEGNLGFCNEAFLYNNAKEIRVNCAENGDPVQVKITFTVAKEAVEPDNSVIETGATASSGKKLPPAPWEKTVKKNDMPAPAASKEENENIMNLCKTLGIEF